MISRLTASAADALSAERKARKANRCVRTHVRHGPMQPTEVPHGRMRRWGTPRPHAPVGYPPAGVARTASATASAGLGWVAAAVVDLHGDRAVVRVGEVELVLAVRVERVEQLRVLKLPLITRLHP